jgi:hypothetical protein
VGGPCTNLPRYWAILDILIASGLCGGLFSSPTVAQEHARSVVIEKADSPQQAAEDQNFNPKPPSQNEGPPNDSHEARGAFVIAPLPISSPALGSGIVPVVAYIFPLSKKDKTSPASILGTIGLVTNNGSRAFALGGQLYFKEDTYRLTAAFLRGNLNYDLYGLGDGSSQSKLPLKQSGQAFFGEFLRRIGWKFFLGPRFSWGNSLITLRLAEPANMPLPPDLGLHTTLTALGFRLNRDTRLNRFYPTAGTLLDFTADFFSHGLGSKYSFQTYKLSVNRYWRLGRNQILAYNLFGCATGGQPPFYGNCIYGTQNQLRGYTAGRYLDRYMGASQLEYRLSLPKRFGIVAFGGLGGTIPGGNQPFRDKNFLPSAGGGLRFELSKKYHVNLRADAARGIDSHTWSMGIGEAF